MCKFFSRSRSRLCCNKMNKFKVILALRPYGATPAATCVIISRVVQGDRMSATHTWLCLLRVFNHAFLKTNQHMRWTKFLFWLWCNHQQVHESRCRSNSSICCAGVRGVAKNLGSKGWQCVVYVLCVDCVLWLVYFVRLRSSFGKCHHPHNKIYKNCGINWERERERKEPPCLPGLLGLEWTPFAPPNPLKARSTRKEKN